MNQTSTVGFLGTGIMGAPMARNCASAGLDVRAWNRTPEKARALADAGVTPVDSPAEAVGGADAVVTMLTDGAAVEAVMAGDGRGRGGRGGGGGGGGGGGAGGGVWAGPRWGSRCARSASRRRSGSPRWRASA